MLLAVLDLARAGGLQENRIYFAPPLLERYARFFEAVSTPNDHPNPYFPFFHLRGELRGGQESFWHLQSLPGRETAARTMKTARSLADITGNIAYAFLDIELFDLLQRDDALSALGETISTHWLDRGLEELRVIASTLGKVSSYERELRRGAPIVREPPPLYIRDPAFRRVVTEAYDYRCCATGLRVVLSATEAMVEAAHILPFCESADDDPRNGLALCPNMHWAMDKNLIAPGPDMKWHVSPTLDRRVPDFGQFFALDGAYLLPPREARFAPKRQSLEWRMERLRTQHPLEL